MVNGQAHNESLVAQLVRAPNRYLGGHGFDSRQGLRIFLCPMLVSLLKRIIFIVIIVVFDNMRTLKFKLQQTVYVILADLSGNGISPQLGQKVASVSCDW